MIDASMHRHLPVRGSTVSGATTTLSKGGHVAQYEDRCECGAVGAYSIHTDARGFGFIGSTTWRGGRPGV